MSYLDIYYRALRDYRQNTLQNRECELHRGATVKANAKDDNVTIIKKTCQIKTDWIEEIERGLEHVDKAIREDRQFIRSNGEVVDIEKVRNVSKDSVKHLAEHSNLITRYEEGKDIIPDRLYIVERLNDYAVYENRFLYMMLCYLRDFITVRYNDIVDLEHTYNATMTMRKKIEMPKRQLSVDIALRETKKDDPYLAARSSSQGVIERIRNILELVHAFLNTPLMEEVSKVAMIKPPITKTNVLRMNQNFRGALALYEYIAAYPDQGYTVVEETQRIQPFRIDMADEFSEVVLLSSFLTYEHGMNIRSDLYRNWEEEEEKRRREKAQRLVEQIKALRRRIQESGESPEEYMVLLEKRNRRLEADSEQLVLALQKIEQLENTVKQLTEENEQRAATIETLNATIEKLHTDYQAQIEALHADYQAQIEALNADYQAQIDALHADYLEQLETMRNKHQTEVEDLHTEYRRQLDGQAADFEAQKTALETAVREGEELHRVELRNLEGAHRAATEQLMQAHAQRILELDDQWKEKNNALQAEGLVKDEQIGAMRQENKALLDARRVADARLQALRAERGMPAFDAETITREEFEELEHQYEAFKSLFGKEWKRAKRDIRKNTFSTYKQAIKDGTDQAYLAKLSGKELPVQTKETIEEIDPDTPDETSPEIVIEDAGEKENEDS